MKALYTLLLSSLLAFLAPALHAQQLGLSLTPLQGGVGEVVCLDFVGQNFDSLVGMQFSMDYDPTVLEFVSAEARLGSVDVSIVASTSDPGSVRVLWNTTASAGFSNAGPFDFGDFCVRILDDAQTAISFADRPIPIEFTRAGEQSVSGFTLSQGTVNGPAGGNTCSDGVRNGNETGVDCGGPDCAACPTTPTCSDGIRNGNETGVDCGGPDCMPCAMPGECGSGDGIGFCVSEACGVAVGELVCLDLTVNDFTDVTSFQFDLAYPAAALDFVSFTPAAGLPAPLQSNGDNDGVVRLIYFQQSQAGTTVPDGDVIGTLCLRTQTATAALLEGTDISLSTTAGTQAASVNPGSINAADCPPPAPTCTDGIQNGDETGVDCGGSCAACPLMVCGDNTGDVSFCVDDVCAAAGARVCVPVFVGNFTDLAGFQFNLAYDAANLTFAEVVGNAALTDGTTTNTSRAGIFALTWNDGSGDGVSLAANVPAYEICFTAQNVRPTPITFSDPGQTLRAFNILGARLPVAGNAGSVNNAENCGDVAPTCTDGVQNGNETGVDCGGPDCMPCATTPTCTDGIQNGSETGVDCGGPDCTPCMNPATCADGVRNGDETGIDCGGSCVPCDNTEPQGNLILNLGTNDGAMGETVCLNLTATDFSGLTDLQFTLSYDPTALTFSGTDNFGLSGLAATDIANPGAGAIALDWSSPAPAGTTVADGTTLVSLCFTVSEVVSTSISFVDAPLRSFATNNNGDPVRIVPVAGRINATVPAVDGLTFEMLDGAAPINGTVCLPVRGFNMDSLVAFQYTAVYDPARLEFIERGDDVTFPFPGSLLISDRDPGVLRIIWNDPQVNGDDDVPDGTVLYSLCFRVLQDGPGPVTFTDTPTAIEFSDINGIIPGRLIDGLVNGSTRPVITSADVRNPSCSDLDDGFISLDVTGGGNYTYQWAGTTATGPVANNLMAGNYSVTITSERGESRSMNYSLTAPPAFTFGVAQLDPADCNGEASGIIELATNGGSAPFTIDWGGNLPDGVLRQENLAAGTYSVTITDGNGCTRRQRSIVVTQPDAIVVTGMVTPMDNNGGAINASVTGSRGTLTYAWTGPNGFSASTKDISALTVPGEYCLMVTDGAGCGGGACFTVGSASALSIASLQANPADCFGGQGSLVVNLSGGAGPFTVTAGGASITSGQSSIRLPLLAGTYTITITDAEGTTLTAERTITAPAVIATAPVLVSDTEDANCTGSIALNPTGGTGGYTFQWSNGGSTATLTGLCAGTYSAVLTDENGCQFSTQNFVIGRLAEELVSADNLACPEGMDGLIDIAVAGGQVPYTFAWRRIGASEILATTEDLSGIGAGRYRVMIQDATGASLVREYELFANRGFMVSSSAASDFNGFNVSCNGGSDGRITTSVNGEGTFTYEYILNDILVSADQNLTGAAAGAYTVRVTGDGGCESTTTVVLTEPTALEAGLMSTDVTCEADANGSLSVTPGGGVSPYGIAWSTGETGNQISGLEPGDYSVTLTDDNACTAIATSTIAEPEDLIVTFEATPATEDCNGSIQIITLTEGDNFTYSWPGLPRQGNNPLAENLCPGDYTFMVTDENECQTVTMTARVEDRRFPCLSSSDVLTPNGDGSNDEFILFCSGDDVATDNTLQIFNRWGQLVFETDDYNCSNAGGSNCFEGQTNDGSPLVEGPYFYVFDYADALGDRQQQRGSFTILRD